MDILHIDTIIIIVVVVVVVAITGSAEALQYVKAHRQSQFKF